MADFNSAFWSYFVAGVTLVSIVALLWFTWRHASSARKRDPAEPVETMGHTWDGDLEEYNHPLPRWWLNLFYVTLLWGLGYLLAYPGLGAFKGMLGWDQAQQYEREMAAADATYGPLFAHLASQPVEQLARNDEARGMGARLFATYCTQCHGADAGGARGYPDLTDQDWLYGGTPQAIETSILDGRNGVMPPWGDALGAAAVESVATYVEHLGGRAVDDAARIAGEKVYTSICAACHGADGAGNQALGAPSLNDDIWLYGGSRQSIVESIARGRNGRMPAHREFLGADKARLLAAYLFGLSGQPPATP
jgi:cytochrome c oxidase cbb3-type subunit 3